MHLQGKSAIVTGAGRGIGREVALLLASEGAVVTVNDPGVGRNGEENTGEKPADEVVAEIEAAGGKAEANYESVADYAAAGRMVQKVVDDHGNSPLKKALLTGFLSTAKHNATKAVSPSSETMRTI